MLEPCSAGCSTGRLSCGAQSLLKTPGYTCMNVHGSSKFCWLHFNYAACWAQTITTALIQNEEINANMFGCACRHTIRGIGQCSLILNRAPHKLVCGSDLSFKILSFFYIHFISLSFHISLLFLRYHLLSRAAQLRHKLIEAKVTAHQTKRQSSQRCQAMHPHTEQWPQCLLPPA